MAQANINRLQVRPMPSDRCPILSVCNVGVLRPNGWTDHDKLGMQVVLGPGHTVLDGDPPALPKKGARASNFWPMSTVAKRSPISATAQHLS